MLKIIYNGFINWYYKSELETAKKSILFQPIGDAIHILNEIKKKVHPKTDAIKKLDAILDIRIKPFQPRDINQNIQKYKDIAAI